MPPLESMPEYLSEINDQVIKGTSNSMLLVGSRFKNYNSVNEYENVTYYDSLKKLVKDL